MAGIVQTFIRTQSKLEAWDKRRNAGVWRLVIVREGSAAPLPGSWQEYVRLPQPQPQGDGGGETSSAEAELRAAAVEEEELLPMRRPQQLMVCVQLNAEGAAAAALGAECRRLHEALLAGCVAAQLPVPVLLAQVSFPPIR